MYQLIKSNDRAIADALESFPPISPKEAGEVVQAQLDHMMRFRNPIRKRTLVEAKVALSFAPALRNRAAALAFVTNDALRLAEAQLKFTSHGGSHDDRLKDSESRELFRKRLAETALTKASAEPPNYLALRYRASLNIPNAARVLLTVLTSQHWMARPAKKSCHIHPRDTLLIHEQARLLSTWYFLKLCVLTHQSDPDGLHKQLVLDLQNTNLLRLLTYTRILEDVCYGSSGLRLKLGIERTVSERNDLRDAWNGLEPDRDDVQGKIDLESEDRIDIYWVLGREGDCDVGAFYDPCGQNTICKPREVGKDIWEFEQPEPSSAA